MSFLTCQGILLPSAARTVTTASPAQANLCSRGVMVFLNITVASGTGGLQVQIQGQDPLGNWYSLTAAPSAITSTGSHVYELVPGAGTATGDVAQRTGGGLPATWRVLVTAGDASSNTYSVGFSLLA